MKKFYSIITNHLSPGFVAITEIPAINAREAFQEMEDDMRPDDNNILLDEEQFDNLQLAMKKYSK